jgi:ribosomal protein S18 acetylase RimI-like enzyme
VNRIRPETSSASTKRTVHLQRYGPADFETLYGIDQACYPRGIAYSRNVLRQFLELPGADCLVARNGEGPEAAVTGFIVAETEGAEAHIITIDVVEAHRRTGIGTALLRAMEQRLAARGVRQVELETATSNAAAVAFWEGHGYRKTGVLRGYYVGRHDAWRMRKTLPV